MPPDVILELTMLEVIVEGEMDVEVLGNVELDVVMIDDEEVEVVVEAFPLVDKEYAESSDTGGCNYYN